MDGRRFVESEVAVRAAHKLPEHVRRSASLATAERLFGHEYHGRFLIELLQNAADAWGDRVKDGERSRLEVVISEGAALLVANQGDPFPAKTVIESLGHIGRSTKVEGQAIGHKGIGFKSVLEISSTPEIYSALGSGEPGLAVRFDRREALEKIRAASPDWDRLAADHVREMDGNELAVVPVLQFPMWVESLPSEVQELADRGFQTVVRVPFRDDLRPDPGLDEEEWLTVVRGAIEGISDEMLLLLGAFDEVVVDDRLAGRRTSIQPVWDAPDALPDSTAREHVVVSRDGARSSRWIVYRRSLPDRDNLAGEIVVGIRLAGEAPGSVAAAVEDEPSAPFYLFFPTKIRSGLPLLLHGYFEVNAARTGFYDGAAARNEAVLRELARLVRAAIDDAASSGDIGLASFVELLGEAQPPDDQLAERFCDKALELLDDVAWVPVEADAPAFGQPTEVLVDEDSLVVEKLREAFPSAYVRKKTGLDIPSKLIRDAGHRFLVSRRPEDSQSLWDIVDVLCRPGPDGPWPAGEEEIGFLALLELFAALAVNDRGRAEELLDELRGEESSALVPVSAGDDRIRMLPLPDPSEGVSGRRSRGIMARTGARGAASLVPPPSLYLAFVPEGLLSSERAVDQAKPLGIRPFTVENVLVRLVGATDEEDEPGELARFLWRLLTRETASEFSVQNAWQRAREFSPAEWFWCQTSPTVSGPDRERQRRRQSLASVRLPARDSSWHPAGTLAFGSDWAERLASTHPASPAREERCKAYAALEEVSPGDEAMLAPPETVGALLGPVPLPRAAGEESEPGPDVWMHAFLLGLGIWETLPVEGFDDAGIANRDRFPWEEDALHPIRQEQIERDGGWTFGTDDWGGNRHKNVWVAQDFRFRWSLRESANRDARGVSRLLGIASPLYERLLRMTVFCRSCSSGGGRHVAPRWSSAADRYPSLLALELRIGEWVAVVLDGKTLDAPMAPANVWWAPSIPAGAALTQSPLRFLPLSDPAASVTSRLRELAGIHSLADADRDSMLRLLERLRDEFEEAALEPDPGSSSGARRAFVGLHRQAYERLADLWTPEEEQEDADPLAVLCDVGDSLAYRLPAVAFHDDGAFASYRRYFSGQVPFAELAKEKGSVAASLGVQRFEVDLKRRDSEVPQDVTEEVADLLADRVPEFLAILVHHVLAGQTLDPTGPEFEARARRLMRLRVYRVDDLVIEARVEGTDVSKIIGEGSDQELFLEGATTPEPAIYHDLGGDRWQEPLRRKLAPHVARILERPDYADIFALFLLDDTDAAREATLLDRGITSAEVDAIRASVGIVSEGEKRLRQRWFGAVVAVLTGADTLAELPEDGAAEAMAAGLPYDEAARIIDYGGGEQARRDATRGGGLEFLRDHGIDLRALDQVLRAAGDDGLRIGVARSRLRQWVAQNGRVAAAVLATRLDADAAKSTVSGWRAPAELGYELDPPPDEWLGPVLDSLRAAGLDPRVAALADTPAAEFLRLSGFEGREQLEARMRALYDPEERRRILTGMAAAWRSELRLLGILLRTSPVEGRAAIRLQAEAVDAVLPVNSSSPTELRPSLVDVLPRHELFQRVLYEWLSDSVSAPGVERTQLFALADEHGIATGHEAAVVQALQAPRRELARQVRENIGAMKDQGLRVAVPKGLGPPARRPEQPPKRRKVAAIKVSPSADHRKRQLGEQGERWALAAMISELTEMPATQRHAAIDEMLKLLNDGFHGTPVEAARAHAEAARAPDLEVDELIDELAGFLHVSGYSDAFGFDMLGWIGDPATEEAQAALVEVKSSADGSFHLSPNEWACAETFEDQYSVLVVRRAPSGGVPQRLDLLNDPAALVSEDRLDKTPNGWIMKYSFRS